MDNFSLVTNIGGLLTRVHGALTIDCGPTQTGPCYQSGLFRPAQAGQLYYSEAACTGTPLTLSAIRARRSTET
jgi:hypothetical protein